MRKWLARFRAGGRAALVNDASVPARSPTRTGEAEIGLILHLRRTFRMSASAIAAQLDLTRWLTRHGLGRLSRLDPAPPARRYQRDWPAT